jgi:hypothetical protein
MIDLWTVKSREENIMDKEHYISMVTDRYGEKLKNPDCRPSVQQSIDSWALTNELIELGYCHNFQQERNDISNYIYKISSLIDKALAIKENVNVIGRDSNEV